MLALVYEDRCKDVYFIKRADRNGYLGRGLIAGANHGAIYSKFQKKFNEDLSNYAWKLTSVDI
jgi:hypothetical protein